MNQIDEFFAQLPKPASNPSGAPQIWLHFLDGSTIQVNLLERDATGILVSDVGGAGQKRFHPWSAIVYVAS
ncbi:MAG: hypothetical protein ACLQUY_15050 [Ktedonobacterales bacterium]